MEKELAYCGIDCAKCDIRKATLENDEEKKKEIASLWTKMNGVEVKPEMIYCEGCHINNPDKVFCNSMCPIRQCALTNKIDICAHCIELTRCEKMQMVLNNNTEARKNIIDEMPKY